MCPCQVSTTIRMYRAITGAAKVEVVLTFVGVPMAALAAPCLSFAAARQAASLPIITAIGSGPAFAYHKSKPSQELALRRRR